MGLTEAAQLHNVTSEEHYRQHAMTVGAQTRRFYGLTDAGPTKAFVNAGRWVVWCHDECSPLGKNAPSASVDWRVAICLECGRVWTPIFPEYETRRRIEWLLAQRPSATNRNWLPGEPLIQLMRENSTHGLESKVPPV